MRNVIIFLGIIVLLCLIVFSYFSTKNTYTNIKETFQDPPMPHAAPGSFEQSNYEKHPCSKRDIKNCTADNNSNDTKCQIGKLKQYDGNLKDICVPKVDKETLKLTKGHGFFYDKNNNIIKKKCPAGTYSKDGFSCKECDFGHYSGISATKCVQKNNKCTEKQYELMPNIDDVKKLKNNEMFKHIKSGALLHNLSKYDMTKDIGECKTLKKCPGRANESVNPHYATNFYDNYYVGYNNNFGNPDGSDSASSGESQTFFYDQYDCQPLTTCPVDTSKGDEIDDIYVSNYKEMTGKATTASNVNMVTPDGMSYDPYTIMDQPINSHKYADGMYVKDRKCVKHVCEPGSYIESPESAPNMTKQTLSRDDENKYYIDIKTCIDCEQKSYTDKKNMTQCVDQPKCEKGERIKSNFQVGTHPSLLPTNDRIECRECEDYHYTDKTNQVFKCEPNHTCPIGKIYGEDDKTRIKIPKDCEPCNINKHEYMDIDGNYATTCAIQPKITTPGYGIKPIFNIDPSTSRPVGDDEDPMPYMTLDQAESKYSDNGKKRIEFNKCNGDEFYHDFDNGPHRDLCKIQPVCGKGEYISPNDPVMTRSCHDVDKYGKDKAKCSKDNPCKYNPEETHRILEKDITLKQPVCDKKTGEGRVFCDKFESDPVNERLIIEEKGQCIEQRMNDNAVTPENNEFPPKFISCDTPQPSPTTTN